MSRRLHIAMLISILLVTSSVIVPEKAVACAKGNLAKNYGAGQVAASATCTEEEKRTGGGRGKQGVSGGRGKAAKPAPDPIEERNMRKVQQYIASVQGWQTCQFMQSAVSGPRIRPEDCGSAPGVPQLEDRPPGEATARRPLTAYIPPAQIAYMAAAQLQIPEPELGFAPDPKWNQWKKAFVNVEYWVWLQSPSELPAASQSVGPASVRLTARLERLSISDNLNGTKTCKGLGSRWQQDTSLFQPSPTCGMRFTEKGNVRFSLTAHWVVNWEINGATGVVRFERSTSRQFEVSELHSVNR